jgi:hypothetical protein
MLKKSNLLWWSWKLEGMIFSKFATCCKGRVGKFGRQSLVAHHESERTLDQQSHEALQGPL